MKTSGRIIVGLLIVALPLSAAASLTGALGCPHQGLGSVAMPHGSHTNSTIPRDVTANAAITDAAHAAMASMSHHHEGAPTAHHACDCAHHCAGAGHALATPVLALDAFDGAAPACDLYRSCHSGSSEPPLLRPPIPASAA